MKLKYIPILFSMLAMASCDLVTPDDIINPNVDEDTWESSLKDLPFPASTDPQVLQEQMTHVGNDTLNVIFSTYQSIQVVSDAQKLGLPAFDLIICDEACLLRYFLIILSNITFSWAACWSMIYM